LKELGTLPDSIVWDYLGKVDMHKVKSHSLVQGIDELSRPARMAMQLWYDGHDVSSQAPVRTFYRWRREILDKMGIDISIARDLQSRDALATLLDLDELRRREVDQGKLSPTLQRSLWGAR
jgi:hypothetical protein